MTEPEKTPPSLPRPPMETLDLEGNDYLVELGRRVRDHAKANVVGGRATREVDMAGKMLIMLGGGDAT